MKKESHDIFGLQAETRIEKSKIRKIFTPSRPVKQLPLLLGRQEEIKRLIQSYNTPGEHALLFGHRGVGKSSLAKVAPHLLTDFEMQKNLMYHVCDSTTSFKSIVSGLLHRSGAIQGPDHVSVEKGSNSSIGIDKAIHAKSGRSQAVTETFVNEKFSYTPSNCAERLKNWRGLLVVDEADSIRDFTDRTYLAEFLKHLSDRDSLLTVWVVGISQTGSDLMNRHKSVSRCLRSIKLDTMSDYEIRQILVTGASKVHPKLRFSDETLDLVVDLSAGYPHFAHLLALKCGEYAISENVTDIGVDILEACKVRSAHDADNFLVEEFEKSTRSSDTDMYRVVMYSAASIKSNEFTARQLREQIRTVSHSEISQSRLNNYLGRLIPKNDVGILCRVKKGVYRFSDPRMASYVRIAISPPPII